MGKTVTVILRRGPTWQARLLGDEELPPNYIGRTSEGGYVGPCTPSVVRFYPEPREKSGDYRVDITRLLGAYLHLNNEISVRDPKTRYLFADDTAIFNGTGYPMQMYTTMQGNRLSVLSELNGWIKFETLTPASNVAGLSYASAPWFVHRFDLVCYDKDERPTTWHKPNTPQGVIDYFLVTKEGYGYVQKSVVQFL